MSDMLTNDTPIMDTPVVNARAVDVPLPPQAEAPPAPEPSRAEQFAAGASKSQPNLLVEMFDFVRQNGKWYLVPVLGVLLLLGLLIVLGGSGLAPFIYPLF